MAWMTAGVLFRIDDHNLQQPAVAVGTDDEHPVLGVEDPAERNPHRMSNVLVVDAVPAALSAISTATGYLVIRYAV